MKKKNIYIGVGILLLVAAIAYLAITFLFNSPNQNDEQKPVKTTVDSLYKLTQTRGNQICTWQKTETGVTMNGTVYITGEKFAMDTLIESEEYATAAHLIGDGKKVYIWNDQAKVPGLTMDYAQLEKPKEGSQNPNGIIYQKMDYSCKDWTPDETKFTLPSDITF